MKRVLAAGVLACLAGHARPIHSVSPLNPQTPAIILDVGVETGDGTPVRKLGQADFEIRVDGIQRPIVSFSAENRSLVLAMLVDMSLSMGNLPIGEDDRNRGEDDRYRRTLEAFIQQLETGDRAVLGRVSVKLALSPPFSDSRALFSHVADMLTVPTIDRMGPSPLWDTVHEAIARVSTEAGLRAVMLWTDGRSTGNHFSIADVVDRAVTAGVSIHLIVEHTSLGASRRAQPRTDDPCASVARIMIPTGGTCLVNLPDRGLNVPPIAPVRRVVNALRHRYAIGFRDDRPDGELHALEVRVKPSGLRVRAPTRFRAAK